jgi:hypothetical protein
VPALVHSAKLSSSDRAVLRGTWTRAQNWKKHLDALPDQNPVLRVSGRPVGSSGVFAYRLSALDYESLSKRFFKERNKLFRRNFVSYVSQLYSLLIECEILPDKTLSKESGGVELYSLDLKRISRNYSEFNKPLLRDWILSYETPHNNKRKKGKIRCKAYSVSKEILKKGIERVFLSEAEKRGLIETIRVSSKVDQTSQNLSPLGIYYASLLKRVAVSQPDFEQLEISTGRFRRLYPSVARHQAGKVDLKFDSATGRLSSVYLWAPREFRKLLRWEGKMPFVEGDVGGSHFHFLLEEMNDPKERERMKKDLLSPDPYLAICGNPAGVSREDLKKSSHRFKYANRVTKILPVDDATSLNAVPYTMGLFYRRLAKRFPRFAYAMAKKKIFHKNHRKDFACQIMKRESKVMVSMVGEQCMKEKLIYLPIHDGFLTLPTQYGRVRQIVTECFQKETGSIPRIKRK